MSWNPVRLPLTDLLTIHARVERLKLVEKLTAAEIHLRAAGLDPTALTNVRRALLAQPIAGAKPMFPPPPPVADGAQPLRYLLVQESRRG